jgi:predicted anti-sigma-YlaC factor YlaD
MIDHLSAEQISQWMVGERTPQLEQHIEECTACRGELAQLESTISQFRMAMRDPANLAPRPEWREPAPSASWFTWPRMVLTATALAALLAVPVSWRVRAHEQALREEAARSAMADSQLLESVDAEISQAVPEPMEPLVTLATWNSSSAEQNQKAH